MQHYFVNQSGKLGDKIDLPKDVAHHFIDVMRAKVGDHCELVLNQEETFLGRLSQVKPAQLILEKKLDRDVELPVHAMIACGLPKTKGKPELIVQKGTELGADQIIFFPAAWSVARWAANKLPKKLGRLQTIAKSAAEQSHRQKIPQVSYCPSLQELLDNYPADLRIVAWEESAKQGEASQLVRSFDQVKAGQSCLGIFGPEGGLTSQEVSQMQAAGVVPAGLGPRILRTETAPLYFLAALSVETELQR